MSVKDTTGAVLLKVAEQLVPGSNADYYLKTKVIGTTPGVFDTQPVSDTITVTNLSAVEIKVGASRLANRIAVKFQALNGDVLYGYESDKTIFEIPQSLIVEDGCGPNVAVYLRAVSGSVLVAISEVAG